MNTWEYKIFSVTQFWINCPELSQRHKQNHSKDGPFRMFFFFSLWVNVHLESSSKFRSSVHQSFIISAEQLHSAACRRSPLLWQALPSECLHRELPCTPLPGPDLCVSQTLLSRCSEKANIKSVEISAYLSLPGSILSLNSNPLPPPPLSPALHPVGYILAPSVWCCFR